MNQRGERTEPACFMHKIYFLSVPILLAGILVGGISEARCDPVQISPADPTSIQRGIDEAYGEGLHRIVIPAGTYRLSADPRSGLHLRFLQMKDFEIDATGATLVFTTRDKNSIRFDHCENVTFRGATLLRDPIPFSQGRVIAISPDGKAIDVQVSQGYPADFDDKRFFPKIDSIHAYNPQTRQWQDEDYAASEIERLGPDSFRFHGKRVASAEGWAPGAAVTWRGRGAPDVELRECQGMKIVGVTIMNGSGFCVFEHGGAGGNYYSYTVTYGPKPDGATEEPLLASNADAFHSDQVRKGPTLEDCHFEGMNDDGIPIHGAYALAISSEGSDAIFQVRYPPFCRAGDHLRLYDERGAAAGEATVVSVEPLSGDQPVLPAPPKALRLFQDIAAPKYLKLTLDHPTGAKFGWLVANADAMGNGFVIRRCTVRNNRARGMLIKASDGLIEDCTVEGSSIAGIAIVPEMGWWNESDYARNIIVRRNTIRSVGYWKNPGNSQAGAVTVAAFEYGHFVPLPGGHRNIVIEDNTFENDDGPNILVSSAQGVVIRNNRFIHPLWNSNGHGKNLGVDPNALIWLTECSGIDLSGNVVSDPGPCLKVLVGLVPTASGTGLDNGVVIKK